MRFDIGETVEVQGDAREGFSGAWSVARIIAKNVGFVTVIYDQFLGEDGQQMVETVEWIRVRPPLEDDSFTVPLHMRFQGEAVDCLAKDCWWEGYVHEVFVGYVTVIFPGSFEDPYRVFPIEARVLPAVDEDPYRLRTTKHYNAQLGVWQSVPALDAGINAIPPPPDRADSSPIIQPSYLCPPSTTPHPWDLWTNG